MRNPVPNPGPKDRRVRAENDVRSHFIPCLIPLVEDLRTWGKIRELELSRCYEQNVVEGMWRRRRR